MSWKKNAFSYLLWFVYTVMAAGALLLAAAYLCTKNGYPAKTGLAAWGISLLAAGLLTLLVRRLFVKLAKPISGEGILLLAVESLAVAVLLGIGIFLRVQGINGAPVESAYFETARIAEGQAIPQIVHGVVYLYLQMLHFLCFLFGNKMAAAIVFQIFLQLGALVFLYMGVRKTAGRIAAVVMLAFAMLSGEMISRALTLSPGVLLLFLFSAGVLFAAGLAGKRKNVYYCLTGIFLSVICYFDVIGVLLLLFACAMAFLIKDAGEEEKETKAAEKGVKILLCVISFCIGFLVMISVDALASGKNVFHVLGAWFALYRPGGIVAPVTLTPETVPWDSIFLIGGMLFGIFSFWFRKTERFSIWVLMALTVAAAQSSGILAPETDGNMFLFLLFTVLAGIGIQEIFTVPMGRKLPVRHKADDLQIQDLEAEPEVEPAGFAESEPVEPESEQPGFAEPEPEQPETEEAQTSVVHYIENPLPLPKKHEKKIMDYKVKRPEKEEFDIMTDEDDDFDI